MNESILVSIKSALGGFLEDETYDDDIKMHINSVFSTLHQLGVGPEDGFEITSKAENWSDFTNNDKTINSVKTYMVQKIKLIFDPPQNAFLVSALEKSIQEYEWRLMVAKDPKEVNHVLTTSRN